MGTARILCGSALQDTLRLGTAGILCGWTHPLSIAGILIGWALQGYLVVGHCRDTWWLGTAGILCGWALQDALWLGTAGILGGWSLKSVSRRARTTSTLKSNNPTARVGNKHKSGI